MRRECVGVSGALSPPPQAWVGTTSLSTLGLTFLGRRLPSRRLYMVRPCMAATLGRPRSAAARLASALAYTAVPWRPALAVTAGAAGSSCCCRFLLSGLGVVRAEVGARGARGMVGDVWGVRVGARRACVCGEGVHGQGIDSELTVAVLCAAERPPRPTRKKSEGDTRARDAPRASHSLAMSIAVRDRVGI